MRRRYAPPAGEMIELVSITRREVTGKDQYNADLTRWRTVAVRHAAIRQTASDEAIVGDQPRRQDTYQIDWRGTVDVLADDVIEWRGKRLAISGIQTDVRRLWTEIDAVLIGEA